MTKWISIKDRLPEYGIDVLVFGIQEHDDKPYIYLAWLSSDGIFNQMRATYDINSVTHWMPLPEVPQSSVI